MKDAATSAAPGEVEIELDSHHSTTPATARNILCEDPQALNRLRYQLNRIHRLHTQARETGIRLDPAACARELSDAIKWATRARA